MVHKRYVYVRKTQGDGRGGKKTKAEKERDIHKQRSDIRRNADTETKKPSNRLKISFRQTEMAKEIWRK